MKSFLPQYKRVNMYRVKKTESKRVSQGLISVGFKWVVKAEVEEGKTEEEEEGEDEVFSMQSVLHDTRAGDRTWMLKEREKAGRMRDGGESDGVREKVREGWGGRGGGDKCRWGKCAEKMRRVGSSKLPHSFLQTITWTMAALLKSELSETWGELKHGQVSNRHMSRLCARDLSWLLWEDDDNSEWMDGVWATSREAKGRQSVLLQYSLIYNTHFYLLMKLSVLENWVCYYCFCLCLD